MTADLDNITKLQPKRVDRETDSAELVTAWTITSRNYQRPVTFGAVRAPGEYSRDAAAAAEPAEPRSDCMHGMRAPSTPGRHTPEHGAVSTV
eukprot:6184874-Pleurochrysis_carterae.AAC.6